MNKKTLIILLIAIIGIGCVIGGVLYSSRMEVPDNPEDIIDTSLKSILGIEEDDRSLASIAFDNCTYTVESVKAHRNNVTVKCHVKSPDVKGTLEELAASDTSMNQDAFLDAYEKALKEHSVTENDVTVNIVEKEDKFVAEFDEATADAFVGGLIEYTEQLFAEMNGEN